MPQTVSANRFVLSGCRVNPYIVHMVWHRWAERARGTIVLLKSQELETCIFIRFATGLDSSNFDYRNFEYEEYLCSATRAADYCFIAFTYCGMDMQLWPFVIVVDGSYAQNFARPGKVFVVADDFWFLCLMFSFSAISSMHR
jgi:hypothetical protein